MGEWSKIEWTHHTFNPWWGCTKVSEECDFCYAEGDAKRYGHDIWGRGVPRRLLSAAHWQEPYKWNRDAEAAGERRRVFCASMADVFDAEAPASEQLKLWALIRETPWLDWLLLTKRPNRIGRVLPGDLQPAPNVWLGASVGLARTAWRIRHLQEMPATIRFLSVEPLLGPIPNLHLDGIQWVILGGESGSRARPCELEWVREVTAQCRAEGVPVFVKQLGTVWAKASGTLKTSWKGGKPEVWPLDLRVREVPGEEADDALTGREPAREGDEPVGR